MFDFPSNPTNGQIITTPSGASYLWDSTKWGPTGTLNNDVVNSAAVGNTGRNLVHNPRFDIAQRGAGAFTSLAGYTADRWKVAGSNDTVSVSLTAASDAVRTAIGDEAVSTMLVNTFTGNAAAGAYSTLQQGVESVRRLAGKTITLSFWAACSSGALKLGVNYLQNFGSGGSPSALAWISATGQSVTLSTTWTRYTVTTAIPSIVGKTLGTNNDDCTWLALAYSSGSTNNALFGNIGVQSGSVYLWGVQLEVGSVATPLAKRDIADELSLCQRFYNGLYIQNTSYGGAGSGYAATLSFPVQMRAIPTIAFIGTSYTNASGIVAIGVDKTVVVVQAIATATGVTGFATSLTASADL